MLVWYMKGKQWWLIDALPVVIPAALAAFGAVAIFFLLLDQFRGAYVWPAGLIAASLVVFIVIRRYPRSRISRERKICNALVLFGAAVWLVFNLFFTSQHVLTNRDPAVYANAGAWLVHHNSIRITIPDAFGNTEGVMPISAGFGPVQHDGRTFVQAQGQHLLPAFLGLFGRIVGVANMLHLNVLFGATALLAIYAFARELARPYWSMIVTGAVAGSMPFLYFSRDTYSEPLAATFTFGALALIGLAIRSKGLSIWFVAGLVAAAGTMTRIDGYLTIAELTVFLGIMLALSRKVERAYALKASAMFAAGMAITAAAGWLDLSQLSPGYYHDLHRDFHQETLAIAASILFAVIIPWLSWKRGLLKKLDRATAGWRGEAAAILVLLAALALVSRPLWMHGSMKIAGVRLTAEWVAWYIGPVLAVLGALGLALSSAVAVSKRKLLLSAGLLVVLGTSALYLVRPSISIDQIWASRRMVPVILAGIAVFGAVTLDRLTDEFKDKVRWPAVYIGLASIAILMAPLITSRPEILNRDTAQLAPVQATCDNLPKNAAVLWLGKARLTAVMPTRSICGVQAEDYHIRTATKPDSPSLKTLAVAATAARSQGYVPVVGVFGNQAGFLPDNQQRNMTQVAAYSYQQLRATIIRPPQGVETRSGTVLLGIIQPDGSIKPLPTVDK